MSAVVQDLARVASLASAGPTVRLIRGDTVTLEPGAPPKMVSIAAGRKSGHSQRTGSRVTVSPRTRRTAGAVAASEATRARS